MQHSTGFLRLLNAVLPAFFCATVLAQQERTTPGTITPNVGRDKMPPTIKTSAVRVWGERDRGRVHIKIFEASGVLSSVEATVNGVPISVDYLTNSGTGLFCVHPNPSEGWLAGVSSLALRVRDPAGNETKRTLPVLNSEPPLNRVHIDEDGFFEGAKGREFPLGIRVAKPEQFPRIAKEGFDVVYVSELARCQEAEKVRKCLDAAWREGLRVAVGVCGELSGGEELTREEQASIVKLVSSFCGHPGLFCWHLATPPEGEHGACRLQAAALISDLDPDHPIVTAARGNWEAADEEYLSSQWIQADQTPEGTIRQLRKLQKQGLRPPAVTLFIPSGIAHDSTQQATLPARLQAIAYVGVMHGVNGIFWQHSSLTPDPDVSEILSRVVRELHQLSPVLMAPAACRRDRIAADNTGPSVETWEKTTDTGTTVIAANISSNPGSVDLFVVASGEIGVPIEGRHVEAVDGQFRDYFGPYSVHVYQW